MAAQHGRRKQTLLFCSLAALKPGETVSTRIVRIEVVTATEQIDLSTRPYLTSRYSASRWQESWSVFCRSSGSHKNGDLDRMPDSDSCASASAQSLQLHSNNQLRQRRHTNTETDLDAEHSAEPTVTMDGPPLASLSLTHVHYDPTSKISHACAFLALVPQALCITYATLIWSTREMEILLMFAGQMGCEALNWVLKRFIREDRPAQMLGKGYGMPSSHAQFVAFFAVYLGLWVVVRHDPWKNTESKTHVPTPMWQRVGLALLAMGGAVAVAQSRMYVSKAFLSPKCTSF
jgi:hypothetical protein